ncbi:tetratricopeptide repeat-containing sensor histidine kinase [Zunongwangia sp.]|uniref:tetratricopeptide repeat-containing sensor histidine kinase n=1 Tax=Zunongwangia sp. TaxID=1965325 RepID=UPI003AA99B47
MSCTSKIDEKQNEVACKNTIVESGKSISDAQEKHDLIVAYKLAIKEENDSIRNKKLLDISYRFLKAKDSAMFLQSNKEARELAISIEDSSGVAATHWDLAQYYHNHNKEDSAYFHYDKAQKIYKNLNNDLNAGSLLLNMAIMQKNIRDYTGSEVTTMNAISLLKPLDEFRLLYKANNNLGIIYNELEDYEKAVYYYQNGLDYIRKSGDYKYLPSIWNNIGLVYHNYNNFNEAVEYFDKALNYNDSIQKSDPKLFAMLIDNKANAKLHLKDTTGIYEQFNAALKIRKELNLESGISINQLHLADYFLEKKDTIRAIDYASKAKAIASKNQNTRDLLSSLKFLSLAVKDSALKYSRRYIEINDSLQKRERTVRNKFARIRFETDEYISETKRLNDQVVRISIISLTVFLIFVLLYIIRGQRSKNKLIQQKHQAGQEIYNLVLSQQKLIQEERDKEKLRISRELHDGVLGSLFGLRISLDVLNEDDDDDSKKKRAEYIKGIQDIAEEIRLISHELNKSSQVDIDFNVLLQEFLNRQSDKIQVQLNMPRAINWDSMENNIKINIYRIIQEATTNILKHSNASKAIVLIERLHEDLKIEIKDDGEGFDTEKRNFGIGLKNIKNRSRNIRGNLSITSGTEGTTISLYIKLKK